MLITHLHGIKDTVESGDDCLIILITKAILANRMEPRCPKLMKIDQKLGFAFKQGRIHVISRLPSWFLSAERKRLRRSNLQTDGPMDRRTDGRTHPLIELCAHD